VFINCTEEVIILKRSGYELYWRGNNIKKKWLWIVLKRVIIFKKKSGYNFTEEVIILTEVFMNCTEEIIILKRSVHELYWRG
jgi:hypothetical protein